MPTDTLDQYSAAHQSMCGSLTSSVPAPAPEDAEPYVSISFEAGDIEPPRPIAGVDPSQPLLDRIGAAFVQGLRDNQGLATADKLLATVTSPRLVLFLGGVAVGVPIGVKNDLVGQVAFIASLVEHVAPPLTEGLIWASNPQVWIHFLAAWAAQMIGDEETTELALSEIPDLPPSIGSVLVTLGVINDTVKVLVPAILDDERLREELMVEASRCLMTIATTSYVERLVAAGDDAYEQGHVVGEVIGELLGLAVVSIVLGIVRLPTTLAEGAVALGEKVRTVIGAVEGMGRGIKAAARATEKAIASLIARLRLLIRQVLERAEEAAIEHVPPPTRPVGSPAVVLKKMRRRRLTLPKLASEILDKYAAKVHPHHVLERVKRGYNRLVKTSMGDWEARLSELSSHHVIEAKYFDLFEDDFKRVAALDENGAVLVDGAGNRVFMQSSDDMSAVLVPSESHYGRPSPQSWGGAPIRRMEEVEIPGPGGSTTRVQVERVYQPSDSFPHGLPSLNDLNNFLDDVEKGLPGGRFANVGELLDWHEYWYSRRFLDPHFDGRTPVSTPLPAPHERMGPSYQSLLRTILVELNRTRADLGLPIRPLPF